MKAIGITIVGITALISFLSFLFIIIFKEEITKWHQEPPLWVWAIVLLLVGISTIGFCMALLGNE